MLDDPREIKNVMITGATGFVGRHVVRELLGRGHTPVCLVRDAEKLLGQHREVNEDRFVTIIGDLQDKAALREAARLSQAAVHLVGIIIARPLRGQTFRRVHFEGTRNVVTAVREAGIRRYVHMSALGTRPNAVSKYHQTKWQAEEFVRASGLDWTIFRPSLIHGPDGEFMQLMKRFMCSLVPPVIPYFGSGNAKLQPVYVGDVAGCFASALENAETVGKIVPLGGPRAYSWRELYNVCRALLPCAKAWKPMVSQPVAVAKAAAVLSAPILGLAEAVFPHVGLLRFDTGQVDMSQEDSVCDHTMAEQMFGIRMRSFEDELAVYADRIR